MTWVELAARDLLGSVAGLNRGMLTATLYRGVTEGLSGRAMLGLIRSGGGAIRTQEFYRVLRAAKAFQGSEAISGAAGLSSPVSDYLFEGNTPEGATKYMSVVTVTYQQEVEGEVVNLTKDIFIRSHEPITVGEAISRGSAVFEQLSTEEDPRYPHGSMVGVEFMGATAS